MMVDMVRGVYLFNELAEVKRAKSFKEFLIEHYDYREDLLTEELIEIDEAVFRSKSLTAFVDGILDAIYILLGTLHVAGVSYDEVAGCWEEIQRSNMSKVVGKIRRREDGKILKPENWKPPQLEEILRNVYERKATDPSTQSNN